VNYYNPDFYIYFANSVAGVAGWFLIVWLVMIWISMTVWKQHVPSLEMMGWSVRLFIGFAAIPPILLVSNLLLLSSQSLLFDSSVVPIINFVIAAVGFLLFIASFICFLLALVPRKPSGNAGQPATGLKTAVKEPWED